MDYFKSCLYCICRKNNMSFLKLCTNKLSLESISGMCMALENSVVQVLCRKFVEPETRRILHIRNLMGQVLRPLSEHSATYSIAGNFVLCVAVLCLKSAPILGNFLFACDGIAGSVIHSWLVILFQVCEVKQIPLCVPYLHSTVVYQIS